MTLRVTFEEFAAAARKHTPNSDALVAQSQGGIVVTAIDLEKNLVVVAQAQLTVEEAITQLEAAGLTVGRGHWSGDDDDADEDRVLYVAAVAYRSREFQPGVWVDAYPYEPSRAEVLRAMYDEMLESGDLKPVEFDEFVRLSLVNVVIVGPDALGGFAANKSRSES